jgi:esterase/lipase
MSYIINKLNQKIAYKHTKGRSPGIVFIHGLNSDMQGLKAKNTEKYAKKNKLAFLRFDCRGHGQSFGKFEDFVISDWKQDLLDVIDKLTKGPQILIGSSMGGWLMILAAKARPKKIVGLIGLSAAADFGYSLHASLSLKNKNEIKNKGFTRYSSNEFSYILTKKFFINAKKNNILGKPFKFTKPFILIHGIKDKVVSVAMPKKIMGITTSNDVQIHFLKSSDHRLSSKKDLLTINNAINLVLSAI